MMTDLVWFLFFIVGLGGVLQILAAIILMLL